MTLETLTVDDHNGVRTVTLDRPDAMNAVSRAMLAELATTLDAAAGDDDTKAN